MVLVRVFHDLAVGIVACRDLMYVDIERHQRAVDRHEIEPGHAGFLARFAQGDFVDLPLPVGMAAELQPAVELAMVRQAGSGDDRPRRSRPRR